MKLHLLLFVILFHLQSFAQSKQIEVFPLIEHTLSNSQKIGFVSLSDVYNTENLKDSVRILPENPSDIQRVPLTGNYRKRLLTGTKTSEQDTVYLYNYENNALVKIPVSALKTIAVINMYADLNDEEETANPNNFMYGFEIPFTTVKKLGDISRVFVCIGNSNPFQLQKLKPFIWKKISAKEFPFSKMDANQRFTSPMNTIKFHYYKSENYQYYTVSETFNRYMIILDLQGNKINVVSFQSGESSTITPITEGNPDKIQFVGSLFKDKPEVFLGFESITFMCHLIYFVDTKDDYLTINCDCRH
jgi:hypothetical protein